MNKDDLLNIFEDDDLGLLDEKKKAVPVPPEDRLLQSFEEINEFVDNNNCPPKKSIDINERKLAARLEHFKTDKDARAAVISLDRHALLEAEVKGFENVEDFFEDDDLDLLEIEDESLFKLEHVPAYTRNMDEIARRKPCRNFKKYEPVFQTLHEDLKNNLKHLRVFTDASQITNGTFFVVGGIVGLVVDMEDLKKDTYRSFDGRMHCIFENGTESNMLFRSLVKVLQADDSSKVITETNTDTIPTEEDNEVGHIYVLKSLSKNPEVSSVSNLYKIGFSKGTVESRIKNAEHDPTYLMAKVDIVSSFKCYNMNPERFERLLHRFFGATKLNIDITDNHGDRYTPKEWFVVPIDIIHEVIERIIDGTIISYRYDVDGKRIVVRDK